MCLFCDVYVDNFIQLSYIFISFLIFFMKAVFLVVYPLCADKPLELILFF